MQGIQSIRSASIVARIAVMLFLAIVQSSFAASKYTMPDIDQDSNTCFAAAASNVIYWLGQNGYPQILSSPARPDTTVTQRELITQIMVQCKTTLSHGTEGREELTGLNRFFKAHGYDAQITCRGINGDPLNDLTWFEKNAKDNVVFILCLAFVKKSGGNQYTSSAEAGHAVSLLSYSKEVAVIHDTAHEAGEGGRRIFRLIPVSNATLHGGGASENVALLYEMEGMRLPPDADTAVLVQAICIEMPSQTLPPILDGKK